MAYTNSSCYTVDIKDYICDLFKSAEIANGADNINFGHTLTEFDFPMINQNAVMHTYSWSSLQIFNLSLQSSDFIEVVEELRF